jgi:glycosyltransferase involved in cell wall biosynthesis
VGPTMGQPKATIVITTKNRREELRRAITSVLGQSVSVELMVIDDGSGDGTAEMIRSEFETVRLYRSEESLGLVVQRNRAAHRASTSIIISIDDDAVFSSATTVEETVGLFSDWRIGAVTIPLINVGGENRLLGAAPRGRDVFLTDSFKGGAHAVRRDVFLAVGGYRSVIFHQGEEEDFCIRMLDRGYIVRLGTSAPILHFPSKSRDKSRTHIYGARNLVLFCWHNVPMPFFLWHLAGTSVNALTHGLRMGCVAWKLEGLRRGYVECYRQTAERTPVSRQTYQLFRYLRKGTPVSLGEVEGQLPRVQALGSGASEDAEMLRW